MTTLLSIVIPAYNEQERIRPTLEEYLEHFRGWYQGDFEIVVVLNGCRDNTRGVVEEVAASAPEVRLAEFTAPLGKGGGAARGAGGRRRFAAHVRGRGQHGARAGGRETG